MHDIDYSHAASMCKAGKACSSLTQTTDYREMEYKYSILCVDRALQWHEPTYWFSTQPHTGIRQAQDGRWSDVQGQNAPRQAPRPTSRLAHSRIWYRQSAYAPIEMETIIRKQ